MTSTRRNLVNAKLIRCGYVVSFLERCYMPILNGVRPMRKGAEVTYSCANSAHVLAHQKQDGTFDSWTRITVRCKWEIKDPYKGRAFWMDFDPAGNNGTALGCLTSGMF